MALPPDAVVDVWIADVSPMIVAQALLAETSVSTGGRQVPIPFELRYDSSRVVADHDYALKAAIRSAGEILFATDTGALVITKGNPTEVQLWAARAAGGQGEERVVLQGTAWRLEDLGGEGALDTAEATLEFPEAGRVAGSGSCNRFFGSVEIQGESIRFGQMGSTRMSCEEAVNNQESKYLRALGSAERFVLEAQSLLIYCTGMERPLRFTRKEP
jgi:putative lipoprotein